MDFGTLDKPLDEDELAELGRFLASDTVPKGCMDLSMLDGFLTALMVGPSVVPPSRWLPLVWGEPEGPEFETIEQAQRITSLLLRHMNAIGKHLSEEPESFEPMFYTRAVDGNERTIADEWCEGFLRGVEEVDFESWREMVEDEEGGKWLAQVAVFATEEGWKVLDQLVEKAPDPDAFHERLVDRIAPAVRQIHAFWLERRKRAMEAIRAGAHRRKSEPGRNDPCPCGSGKKFKKCCGGT